MPTPLRRYEDYALRAAQDRSARAQRFWLLLVIFVLLGAILLIRVWPNVHASTASASPEALKLEQSAYYPNCAAARTSGAAPIYAGQPGYRPELDADSDGIACEPYAH